MSKPLILNLREEEWGECEQEQKKEFNLSFDKFVRELSEAITSMNSETKLMEPDEDHLATAKNANTRNSNDSKVKEMMAHFHVVFENWTKSIQEKLDDTSFAQDNKRDEGPRTELDYWRKRMQKLICLSKEMKSPTCQLVHSTIIHGGDKSNDTRSKGEQSMFLLNSRWKSLEMKVTEALNEAKDNVKYLTTLEKFIQPLYEGTPETIKDTLPALMNSIKMIHTIARYYNTNDRMTELFKKITL